MFQFITLATTPWRPHPMIKLSANANPMSLFGWVKRFAIFWQYMRHNSAVPNAFVKVVNITNHTWDVELAWYFPSATRQICRGHEDDESHWTVRSRPSLILARFASWVSKTATESIVLSLPDLVWSSRFVQSERNILNRLVTLLWSTEPSHFA